MPFSIKVISKVTARELITLSDDEPKVRINGKVYDIGTLGALENADGTVAVVGQECDEEWEWESCSFDPEVEMTLNADDEVEVVESYWRNPSSWHDCLPVAVRKGLIPMTEEIVWEAIAEYKGCDASEIADGDLIEHL